MILTYKFNLSIINMLMKIFTSKICSYRFSFFLYLFYLINIFTFNTISFAKESDNILPHSFQREATVNQEILEENEELKLIKKIEAEKLWESKTWQRLGHWRKSLIYGWKSESDGKNFFLDPSGKYDPKKEMLATLKLILNSYNYSKAKNDKLTSQENSNTALSDLSNTMVDNKKDIDLEKRKENKNSIDPLICKYPARTIWLTQVLGIDKSILKDINCTQFKTFLESVNAKSLTFVFSSYYLSNPSSIFGHTFLRLNKSSPLADNSEKKELIDYGIDFSADTNTKNPVVYMVKGLLGMFPGNFHRLPYFYKVREYNDYESRDLFEYELKLNHDNMNLFLAHLWELGSTHFNYFYIDENCSYHILGLLEAIEPSWDLLKHVKFFALPADTVKALFKEDIVSKIKYRPSLMSQFLLRTKELSKNDLAIIDELVSKPNVSIKESVSTPKKIQILDSAMDLVDIRYRDELIAEKQKDDGIGAKIKQSILEQRAKILQPSKPLDLATKEKIMPHIGHGSSRLALSLGASQNNSSKTIDRIFTQLEYRMLLHDLLDLQNGYPEFAEVEALVLQLRSYYTISDNIYNNNNSFYGDLNFAKGNASLSIESFSFIKMQSLQPITFSHKKSSLHVNIGAKRLYSKDCRGCFAGALELGTGLSSVIKEDLLTTFLFADLGVYYSSKINGWNDLNLLAGIGPSAGVRLKIKPELITLFTAKNLWFPKQNTDIIWDLSLKTRWSFKQNMALDLFLQQNPLERNFSLSFMWYY